jgi:phenylalanyl-tRNA synthetase beta chain
MLCSEEELSLEEKSTGIMILPSSLEPGKDLASTLKLKDYVLEIELTPNRADCLSMVGIAREVAALYDTHVTLPSINVVEDGEDVEKFVRVAVEVPEFCPRYTARYVSNISIQPSPLWLRRRLELAGIRSINNVVDVTNYILLEWGQPMHAFDYTLLDKGKIIVKKAAAGEKFFTLDNKERVLDEDTLMICDSSKSVALAGIMGGLNTEVTDNTSTLLLESAYFHPHNISRTSRKLGIKSESSLRFEKGIDPESVVLALNRAAQLVAELANGKVSPGLIDVCSLDLSQPSKVTVNPQRVNRILGTTISPAPMVNYLERLGVTIDSQDQEKIVVSIPSYRRDLKEEIDLVEEIARLHGYEKIPETLPSLGISEEKGKTSFYQEAEVRSLLSNNGFFEVITYSFISPEMIKALNIPDDHSLRRYISISNPLSKDQSVMRTTLLPGLLSTVVTNHNHKNMDLKIFEMGKVFFQEEKRPLSKEKFMLSGLICGLRGEEAWNNLPEQLDFYDLKGFLENIFHVLSLKNVSFRLDKAIPYFHPGLSSRIMIGEDLVGVIGEIHPHVLDYLEISKKIFVFEVDFGKIIHYCNKKEKWAKPLPKFPSVSRDCALIVDEGISCQTIVEAVVSARGKFLQDIKVFDLYQGEPIPDGKKSLAFRMIFQAPDRSLTDEEVNAFFEKILSHLKNKMEIELRK